MKSWSIVASDEFVHPWDGEREEAVRAASQTRPPTRPSSGMRALGWPRRAVCALLARYEDQRQFAGVMLPIGFCGVTPFSPLWISVSEVGKFGCHMTGSCLAR